MKKFLSIFLSVCTIFSIVAVNLVLAQDAPSIDDEPESDDIVDIRVREIDYATRDLYLKTDLLEQERIANSPIQTQGYVVSQAWVNWNVTKYFQDDSRWGSNKMQSCGKTIADAGCALTAFTMITSKHYYLDDPGAVNATVGSYACPLNYDGVGRKYNLSDEPSIIS